MKVYLVVCTEDDHESYSEPYVEVYSNQIKAEAAARDMTRLTELEHEVWEREVCD